MIRKREIVILYLKEILLLGLVLGFYLYGFYYRHFLVWETKILLTSLYVLYAGVILPFKLFIEKRNTLYYHSDEVISFFIHLTKYFRDIKSNQLFKDKNQQIRVLFFIVRVIFIPAMTNFMIIYMKNFTSYFTDGEFSFLQLSQHFEWYFFITAMTVIIDLGYFSFGYLIESKRLKNSVKSVDTTVLGWVSALACYVPFNIVTNQLLPMLAKESIFFINNTMTSILYVFVLFFYFIYLSATLSLGSKCSNLTNRGIVTRGAYRFVRHPAYVGKIVSWWLLCIPIMNMKVFISMAGWTVIYIMRALTEEKHLGRDSEYLVYQEKTKWRFVPGLL